MAGDTTRTEIIEGGLLVYLYNSKEAQKVANLKNSSGENALSFRQKDGTYKSGAAAINNDSIQQVQIAYDGQTHYFKRIAANDGTDNVAAFRGTAWIETDANGKALDGKCEVTMCYGGYAGGMPPDTVSVEGRIVNNIMSGIMNPQNLEVKGFVDKALEAAKKEGTVTEVHAYGHSAGASNAMLSNAITGKSYTSDAVLVEPLMAADAAVAMSHQMEKIAPGMGLTIDDLKKNTTSVFAEMRDAEENTIDTALNDHKAYNMALNGRGLQDGNKRTGMSKMYLGAGVGKQFTMDLDGVTAQPGSEEEGQSANGSSVSTRPGTLGDMIMGVLSSLLGGGDGGLMDMFAGLLQGVPTLNQSGVQMADASTRPGAGTVPLAFDNVGVSTRGPR